MENMLEAISIVVRPKCNLKILKIIDVSETFEKVLFPNSNKSIAMAELMFNNDTFYIYKKISSSTYRHINLLLFTLQFLLIIINPPCIDTQLCFIYQYTYE